MVELLGALLCPADAWLQPEPPGTLWRARPLERDGAKVASLGCRGQLGPSPSSPTACDAVDGQGGDDSNTLCNLSLGAASSMKIASVFACMEGALMVRSVMLSGPENKQVQGNWLQL